MLNTSYETMTEFPLQTVSISSSRAKEQITQNNRNKRFCISSVSDKGSDKEENQDSLLIKYGEAALGHCALLAVADGVGGLTSGEQASRAVKEKLRGWWDVTLKTIAYRPLGNTAYLINESLTAAINSINQELYQLGEKSGCRMGTTLSLLFIMDDWYCIKHAGDSRIYLLAHDLKQLTEDDNLLNQHLKAHKASDDMEDYRGYANIITKCIGASQTVDLFEQSGRLGEKNSFMLCTDGFYKRISHNELFKWSYRCSRDTERTQTYLQELINKARRRGEMDDISVIVVNPNKHVGDLLSKIASAVKGC